MAHSQTNSLKTFYFTDVEGDLRRFETAFENNPLVQLVNGEIILAPDAQLIFGGDAIDRGAYSRQIVRALLQAKRRYGARVILIGGNRDNNKWRLVRELAGKNLGKLKEILTNTMGAPKGYEFRREELARERNVKLRQVSDTEVDESYRSDLLINGELGQFLMQTQVAFIDGPTLYVHGGVTAENLGVVPGFRDRITDIPKWVEELNKWHRDKMKLVANGKEAADFTQYQGVIRDGSFKNADGSLRNPFSTVYGRLDYDLQAGSRDFLLLPDWVLDALVAAGIKYVVFGHTPQGQTPTVMHDGVRPVYFICMDTSRNPTDRTSQLFIDGEKLEVRTKITVGEVREKNAGFTLPLKPGSILGKRLPDFYRVKAFLEGGDLFLSTMKPAPTTTDQIRGAGIVEKLPTTYPVNGCKETLDSL